MRVVSDRLRLRLAQTRPMLRPLARDALGLGARVLAYVGVLAALGIFTVQGFQTLLTGEAAAPPAPNTQWVAASRPTPAFALSQFDFGGRAESYAVLRHPSGARKDILRWAALAEAPAVEIEIYRAGDAAGHGSPIASVAARMDPVSGRGIEAAGRIDTKFGPVSLIGLSGQADARPCTGFLKVIPESTLRLSGYSCLGDTAPARRAAIGCMLDRLMLLSAGSDPKLAEIFARAELRRGACSPGRNRDWLAEIDNPALRAGF